MYVLSGFKKKSCNKKNVIHSEVQGHTPAEWRGRECLDLEMWVRLILDRMTAETATQRDGGERKRGKTAADTVYYYYWNRSVPPHQFIFSLQHVTLH